MSNPRTVTVAGAGGFIGGHLVAELIEQGGHRVRAVDRKSVERWHQHFPEVENLELDLADRAACDQALDGTDTVYNLAADMGGMGFIEGNKALCMLSVLINTHLLAAAVDHGVDRYFYASSACVYPVEQQSGPGSNSMAEDDAYPASPEDGYGWEKLFGERMCRHFREDFGLATRVARFHNVYGAHGVYDGGREKAPAAICRKVAEAELSGGNAIEIWGDGEQVRSFTYIDDCITGIGLLMDSEVTAPLNLGSSEAVTISQLVDLVEELAGVTLDRRYRTDAPQGVRGRNSDNRRIRQELGWEPSTPLREGMKATYEWVRGEMAD